MTLEQNEVIKQMEKQIDIVGFTPLQALTMVLSYYKGGYYEHLSDQQMEEFVKAFANKFL